MGKKLPFLKVVRGHTPYWKGDANFRSQQFGVVNNWQWVSYVKMIVIKIKKLKIKTKFLALRARRPMLTKLGLIL